MTYAGFGSLAGPDTGGGDYSRNANVNLNANVSGYQSQMSQAAKSTSMVSGAVDTLSSKLDGLSKRAGHKLEIISAGDIALLSGAAAGAVAFQKQLGTLSATAAVTRTSFQGLKSDVENAFTKFPASRGQVVQLVEAISDLGITSTRSIGSLTQTFLKLGAATGEPVQGLATGLIQLSRLMGTTSATQIGNYANSLLTVSKNSGVSATGVLNFAQAIAPMARQAGIGEAAVLGISAAFTKAGADGYVAANTFNSIVQDITNLTQTGSPQLAKYASAIGDTLGQFKNLSGTQQITALFQTIAKGGPQAINLVNQLGLGTRALSAVQAVSQSGGLTQAINQAVGASSNQTNLNKGSSAAMNDVVDNLARIRNQFTQLGTTVGTTFLTPLTKVTGLFASWAGLLTAAVKPFAPLIAGVGAVAGVAGGIAGVGLAHIGAIGTLAAGRLLLSPNSGPRRALREGRTVGAAEQGGMSEDDALALNRSGQMFAAGGMPLRASIPFRYGRYAGQLGGASLTSRISGSSLGQRFQGLGSATEGEGPGLFSTMGRAAALAAPRTVGFFARSQTTTMRNSRLSDYDREPYAGESGTGGFSGFVGRTKESAATEGTMKAFTSATLDATKALGVMALETGKAGASAAAAGVGFAAGKLPGVAGSAASLAGRAASTVGRGIGSAASMAGSALFSPLGFAAMIGGPMVLDFAKNRLKNTGGQLNDDDFNAISKYDQLLGQTSINLASFGSATTAATATLAQMAGTKTLSQVAQVTSTDTGASTGGYKVVDKNFTGLAKSGSLGAAVSYIQTLGVENGGMNSSTLQQIKQDLIATYGPTSAQKILNAYVATTPSNAANANPNYGTLGTAARGVGNNGAFKSLLSQGASSIQSGMQVNPGQQSSQAGLGQALQLFGTSLTSGGVSTSARSNATVQAELAKLLGGSASNYTPNAFNLGNYTTNATSEASVLATIVRSKPGQTYLNNAGIDFSGVINKNGTTNQGALQALLKQLTGTGLPGPATAALTQQINGTGSLGRFLTGNPTVQAGVNNAGSPYAQVQSQQTLYGAGMNELGGNTNAVVNAFTRLEASAGDLSSGLGLAAANAESYARQQQSAQLPNMSQEGQLQTAASNYAGDLSAIKNSGGNPDPALVAQAQQDQTAYQNQGNSYIQYLNGRYQQLQQYNVQSERAAQDEQTQMYRSQLAYQIQSTQAAQDYQRQVQRTNLSYQIQTTQSQQDYLIQRNRTQRDYDVQLKNEAQTAAQTVYNPFQQIQSQYTLDAASLAYNLQNQNSALIKQQQELQQAQGLGLSLQSIQELSLADPNNAQQLDSLVQSLMQDPKLAQTINTEIAQRLKATTSLTQSQFSLEFVQSQAQFQTQLKDTAQDFETAEKRAAQAQALTLNQMAQDFATSQNRAAQAQALAMSQMGQDYSLMVSRAAQDLGTATTQLYGSFGDAYSRVMNQISAAIKNGTPNLSGVISQLQSIKGLVGGLSAGETSSIQLAGQAGIGIVQAEMGTIGYNNAHILGYYTTSGKFTPVNLAGGALKALEISQGGLPNVYNPITGLASGAIATGARPLTNTWGEAGPEAMIPLNARGEQFMGGMIAKSLANGIVRAGGGSPLSQSSYADYRTEYNGPITVMADDPRAMERQLAQRRRVQRLTQPASSQR